MAYVDDYSKTNWVNNNTPAINQSNLNHAEQGIKNNCGRVANLSTTKAEQSDLLTVFKSVSFDSATGTFTFTKFNDTTVTINTDLEKLAVNFDYDDDPNSAHYQNLVITLADGTVKYADLSALITQYEFTDTATIDITVSAGGTISASVIDGSITASKLQPNFLADCQAAKTDAENAANDAESDALVSEGYAKGTQNGTPVASGSPYYQNNAEWFKNQAQQIAGSALGGLSDVTITTPSNGQVLIYDADNNIWINSSCDGTQTVSGNPLSFTTESAQAARAVTVTLNPIQASGTPTPSNPLPISGYDNVEAHGCGINQWDEQWEVGAIDDATGLNQVNSSKIRSKNFIPVIGGATYYVKSASGSLIIFGYNRDKNAVAIGNGTLYKAVSGSFTVPQGISYVRFYPSYGNYGSVYLNDISLNYPASDTSYHPYTETTNISLTLPSTIYGGILDVKSGKLTVNRGIVDMGDLNWSIATSSVYGTYFNGDIQNIGMKKPSNYNVLNPNTKLSNYELIPRSTALFTELTAFIDGSDSRVIYLSVKDGNYANGNAFKTSVTGQKLVYELATPYEIQLTPQQISLLQGANVITSNGTIIALTYREGVIANLKDVEGLVETINRAAEIADGDKSASQITAGTFKDMVKANPTAMANLGVAQVRSIIITDTAPTVGSSTTIPDGTLIIVYE